MTRPATGNAVTPRAGTDRQAVLRRRVRRLVAATMTYNVVEAVVAITAGIGASSVALVGFGLDSTIEVASAAAVAWQFAAPRPEERERVALRIIGASFFALAGYVTFEALRSLATGSEADRSTAGLVLTALSLAIMPVLSLAQRRTGQELGSASAVADSKQTLLCTYLSAVVLVGLGLNAAWGWSWADPLAGLAIAAIALREGRDAWGGESCCTPIPPTSTAPCPDACCEPTPTTAVVALRGSGGVRPAPRGAWPRTLRDRRGSRSPRPR